MPKVLSMKKSKPKQRTNWKQRALHCEEVIGVQNVAAESREKRIDYLEIGLARWRDRATEACTKLELAEKRLAEFKRSEYFVSNACVECGSKREEKYMNYVCYSAKCLRACADKLDPIRTHWQRFKSWLGGWKVAVLCVAFVLCCLAAFAAFVLHGG